MTNYPNSQDNNITLPGVSGLSQEDIAITALREAAFAIEKELGVTPSGVYSDVRARLDILEARINDPASPTVLSDGYVNSPLYIVNTPASVTLSISDGSGVPTENRIDGSLYMRSDGYANNELYVRRSGAWYPIQTDVWVAAGDLAGTYTNQTVVGIQTKPLRSTLTTVGAVQDGYHLTWNNTDGYWEAQTGFIPGRDLAVFSGPYGRTGQTVIGLQNRNVSSAAPGFTGVSATTSNGDGLAWDPVASQWQPRARAVIFDGYTNQTNLRSNKLLQSPIDNTKVGIINFGSRSTGASLGATADYAAILSGDRHSSTGNFSLIVGGDTNTSSSQFSTVLNGTGNTANTGTHATVLGGISNSATGVSSVVMNGNTNAASAQQSFVLDGYSNTASAINAFVLNGGNNQANASFSGVLGGISNVITLGATHSGIGWGTLNAITAAGLYSVIAGGSGNSVGAAYDFVGSATNVSILSDYGFIGSGLGVASTSQRINASSPFSTIVNGNGNIVSASTQFGFIGTGGGNTVTGNHATILSGVSGVANGLHSLVLNGSTNSVTGTYSTIINGNANTISGNVSYATVVDGYSNTLSGNGAFVGDGYSNTISGIWSAVVSGNNNTISGRNNTILNGSSNNFDANSTEGTVLFGIGNTFVNSSNVLVTGYNNTLTNANTSFVVGAGNSISSAFSFTNGSNNTSASGATFNRIWGSSNTIGTNATLNAIFGNSNALAPTVASSGNLISGSNNTVDGYNNSAVLGSTNNATAAFSLIQGQYGRSRLFGQSVHANARFNGSAVGEAQWSRVVLSGSSTGGSAIPLLLQDPTTPYPIHFQNGYSYDLQIRVLVVNTSPIGPNPVVPARFVFDVLAHQESGTLIIDHIEQTLLTPNTSDDPSGATRSIGWSVTVSPSGNQLLVTVDPELGSANYVQPGNTPSARRAVATIEMREITRL